MKLARAWVALCARREGAEALAAVRICVGLAMFCDFARTVQLGLARALWAPVEYGGIGPFHTFDSPSPLLRWLGPSSEHVSLIVGIAGLFAFTLCIGFFTRLSALAVALASAQLAHLSPEADHGIDILLRNVLFVLACSSAGATLSLDARLRHGRFLPDTLVPAWPRYFLIAQIALLYFSAGVLKQSPPWTSLDGFSALYITLNQPHYAARTLRPEFVAAVYPLLQLATFLTIWFERAGLLLPALVYLRESAARGGRLRRLINGARILELWVVLGVTFHLGLAVTLLLGVFPWGCLALYPALSAPHHIRRVALAAHSMVPRMMLRTDRP